MWFGLEALASVLIRWGEGALTPQNPTWTDTLLFTFSQGGFLAQAMFAQNLAQPSGGDVMYGMPDLWSVYVSQTSGQDIEPYTVQWYQTVPLLDNAEVEQPPNSTASITVTDGVITDINMDLKIKPLPLSNQVLELQSVGVNQGVVQATILGDLGNAISTGGPWTISFSETFAP